MEKLLDKTQQQVSAGRVLFSEALKLIVADFPKRSQEIIFARYGVFGSKALTLEEIGKKYSITRERVRQVIREVLKKVREKKSDPTFLEITKNVVLAISENGGIMKEENLLSMLGKGNTNEAAAVSFFLECIDQIQSQEIKEELSFSYALPDFDLKMWRTVKNSVLDVLKNEKKPLSAEELLALAVSNKNEEISLNAFTHYLEVSQEIGKNNFDKWGIAQWKEISPKGTREKAYLVLKEAGKPLHFREIAKKIDQYLLNKKKTHPQTVHNELIKDKNFVLVGRGIYALAEWGYKKGTVKDVIEEILKKSPAELTRDEILKKVLEIRHVKKSTIVINLNNYFTKSQTGKYSLKK